MPPSGPFRADHETTQGVLCGMGAGALWGLVFLAPELVGGFTPLQLAIGRYLAYGLIAAVLIAPRWRRLQVMLTRDDWVALSWLSMAGNIVYYILLSAAVQMGGIAMTSLVIGFLPVAVTLIGSRDQDAAPLARMAPSLLLCCAGALCIGWQAVSGAGDTHDSRHLLGLACAVGALVSWGAFAVGNARHLRRVAHISAQDWNLLTGLLAGLQATALIPLTLVFEPLRHPLSAWSAFAAVSVAVALGASIFGNALWHRMSRLLPLTLVGQMILFETMFALFYGFAWERRLPHALELVAFGLVAASVFTCFAAHRAPRRTRDIGDVRVIS